LLVLLIKSNDEYDDRRYQFSGTLEMYINRNYIFIYLYIYVVVRLISSVYCYFKFDIYCTMIFM